MRPVLLLLPLLLGACSSERILRLQERQWSEVDREARGLVHNGMPVAEAMPALSHAGYACSASSDAMPRFDCTRQRRLDWTIANCIERVSFVGTAGEGGTVTGLAVPKPACIGTP